MQSPEIVLYTNNMGDEAERKWKQYAPYIFRGSDLLNKNESGSPEKSSGFEADIPERIQSMLALYAFGDGSFQQKCLNFVRQGKFMEDYEDDSPWYGNLMVYFPVYHDLNIKQLRGYFTWRTQIRNGKFTRTCSTFAYLYVYELLNGIGADNAADSFQKLLEFRNGYIETGMGDVTMKHNIKKWLFEFAVTHLFPGETTMQFAESGILERDHALAVLRNPGQYGDEEVFQAIRRFASSSSALSTVLSKNRGRGVRLFAEIWRHIASKSTRLFETFQSTAEVMHSEPSNPSQPEKDIFTMCFGEKETRQWHPLANAIYADRDKTENIDFHLDECRRYFRSDGEWQVESYNTLSGDRTAFMALMHAADRRLRKLLKSGHYLHQKKGDEWAMPYIDAAIEEIRTEETEAARPKISIDLSGLDKIREDANITRDSLLTEYEVAQIVDDNTQDVPEATYGADISKQDMQAIDRCTQNNQAASNFEQINKDCREHVLPETDAAASGSEHEDEGYEHEAPFGLSEIQAAVLRELLAGRSVNALIAENHLMETVVADSINEILFDEIGDNVIECADDGLMIVDDYMDDVIALTGGMY